MERWKDIPGFHGYQASSRGRLRGVRGVKAGSMRPVYSLIAGSLNAGGYLKSAFIHGGRRRDVYVHRMVAIAFHGSRHAHLTVNHRNGNRRDNRPTNLEFVTRGQNSKLAWFAGNGPRGKRHGRHTKPECSARGERIGSAKLTVASVRLARAMRKRGTSYKRIARMLGVCTSQAFNVCSGKHWRHVK